MLKYYRRDGTPLIFETMVFGGLNDQDMERYSTEREAMAGHDRMCRINSVPLFILLIGKWVSKLIKR